MFKKVFGSQMAASVEAQEDRQIDQYAEAPAEPQRNAPNNQPLFVPHPQVLTTKEEENLARRAEHAAEHEERMRQQQAAPHAPVPSVSEPQATPPRPAGRARTRLLGFSGASEVTPNPMAGPVATPEVQQFPTGWIVIVSGPGKGHFFSLFNGVSTIGRDEGQAIALAFGVMTISRENHAAIAYDSEDNTFYVGHGGKSNIIRLNGRPVLSTETLGHGDTLRIGETVLRFAAFCGPDFDWAAGEHD